MGTCRWRTDKSSGSGVATKTSPKHIAPCFWCLLVIDLLICACHSRYFPVVIAVDLLYQVILRTRITPRHRAPNFQSRMHRPKKRCRSGALTQGIAQPPPAPWYNFGHLASLHPEILAPFLRPSSSKPSVDFSLDGATLAVTRAILLHHFSLLLSLPPGHLVPTVPARLQYLSWAFSLVPGKEGTLLDIGTGPSAIYALLGARTSPKWRFVATDTDPVAVESAERNVAGNNLSSVSIVCRDLSDALVPSEIFFRERELPDLALTVCNPPFYNEGCTPVERAPPGTDAQLETRGGEVAFLERLGRDSRRRYGVWFTSLVGVKADLPDIISALRGESIGADQVVSVELAAGARTTRWAVGWRFEEITCGYASLKLPAVSKWRATIEVSLGNVKDLRCGRARVRAVLEMSAVSIDGGWVLEKSTAMANVSSLKSRDGAVVQCLIGKCARSSALHSSLFFIEAKVEEKGNHLRNGMSFFIGKLCLAMNSIFSAEISAPDKVDIEKL